MLVCHCDKKYDCDVRKAIKEGNCTVKMIRDNCLCCSNCKGCAPLIKEIINEELEDGYIKKLPTLG